MTETRLARVEDFTALDIRVGTIVEANTFPAARRPAYRLQVDFGEAIGVKQSSAQITERYQPAALVGKQVLAVVNFPPRYIAGWRSDVLVLGVYTAGGVVLIRPDESVENGVKLG